MAPREVTRARSAADAARAAFPARGKRVAIGSVGLGAVLLASMLLRVAVSPQPHVQAVATATAADVQHRAVQ